MLIAYLTFGIAFGAGAAAFTLLNGGGIWLALLAYSAGGAVAILAPLMVHMFIAERRPARPNWDDPDRPVSA